MTDYSQSTILKMIVFSLGIGIFIGLIYDLFRIRRALFSRNYYHIKKENTPIVKERKIESIIIFFEDILFFLTASLVNIIFIYYANNGKIRGICFLFEVLGFTIYFFTLGKLFTAVAEYAIMYTRRFVKVIFRKLFSPVLKLLYNVYCMTLGRFVGRIETLTVKRFDIKSKRIWKDVFYINTKEIKNERKVKRIY